MEEILALFDQLRSLDIEQIESASSQLIELMKNTEIIDTIIEIISTDCDIFYRQQAVILLKNIIKTNAETDFNSLVEPLFAFINKETNQNLKNCLIDCIINIETTNDGKELSSTLIDAVLSSPFSEMTYNTIRIIAESKEIDSELHEKIAALVSSGIDNNYLYYSLLLGFRIAIESENEEFISMLWDAALRFLQSNEGDEQQILLIANDLEKIIEMNYEFVDLLPLIEWLLNIVKEESVNITKTIIFCDLMANATVNALENGQEITTENQFEIYVVCLNLSAKLYAIFCNDGTINDIDIFERICPVFSQNQEFVEAIFTNIEDFASSKERATCFIISLAYCYKNIEFCINEVFNPILELICSMLSASKPITFEASVVSLHVLMETFPQMFAEEHVNEIVSNLIQGMEKNVCDDAIELISVLFKKLEIPGELVASLYEFIKQNINESSSYSTLLFMQSIQQLIINEHEFIDACFDDLLGFLNQEFLTKGAEYIVSETIHCISLMSFSEQFIPKCAESIDWIVSSISGENDIAVSALKGMSRIIGNCKESIDPSTTIQNIVAILSNHESDTYVYSLALSTLCYIANIYPDNNSELIPAILQSFEFIIQQIDDRNISLVARSLSNFAALSEQYSDIPEHVYSIADSFLEHDIDAVLISEVYSSFVQIVDNATVEEAGNCISRYIPLFVNNELPNENGIDNYDETLFSMVSFLIKRSINAFGEQSFSFYAEMIERFSSLLESDEAGVRDFAIQFFGELFSIQAPQEKASVAADAIKNIIEKDELLTEESVYAIQQIVNGNPQFVSELFEPVLAFLLPLANQETSSFNETIIATIASLILKGASVSDGVISIVFGYGEAKFNDYESDIFTEFATRFHR